MQLHLLPYVRWQRASQDQSERAEFRGICQLVPRLVLPNSLKSHRAGTHRYRSNPFVSRAPQFSLFQRAILTKSRVVIMPDESWPTGDFQPLVGGRVYPNHDGWQQFLQTPRRLPQASATTTPAMHSRSHSCSKHSLILPQEYQPNRQLRPRFMANISPFVGPSAICDLRELLHRLTTNSKNRPRPTQHPLLTTPVLRKVDAEIT